MINTSITSFRKNLFNMVQQTIKFNEPINVATKDGNAVLISEEDYRSIEETLYLLSIPGMGESIVTAMNAPDSDFVDESEVEW